MCISEEKMQISVRELRRNEEWFSYIFQNRRIRKMPWSF